MAALSTAPSAAIGIPKPCSRARLRFCAAPAHVATLRCGDRGIRVGWLNFFKPFEDPEFLEMTQLIRFGLKRNTPGKKLRSSRRLGYGAAPSPSHRAPGSRKSAASRGQGGPLAGFDASD